MSQGRRVKRWDFSDERWIFYEFSRKLTFSQIYRSIISVLRNKPKTKVFGIPFELGIKRTPEDSKICELTLREWTRYGKNWPSYDFCNIENTVERISTNLQYMQLLKVFWPELALGKQRRHVDNFETEFWALEWRQYHFPNSSYEFFSNWKVTVQP